MRLVQEKHQGDSRGGGERTKSINHTVQSCEEHRGEESADNLFRVFRDKRFRQRERRCAKSLTKVVGGPFCP